jgi:hypothetical protein
MIHLLCTVINVPACVVKPLYIAIVGGRHCPKKTLLGWVAIGEMRGRFFS